MLKIKSVTAKNFLSIGAVTQSVVLDQNQITLVLGTNLDLGGEDTGNRNGVGKSVLANIVSYALYGQALTNIRKENLINKTNGKGMCVTIEFETNGINYKIERGRKPNVLRLYANDKKIKDDQDQGEDESQGDTRETQKSIEQILEMSHTMFKHLVMLNTYTEPFLSMKAADQREVIEQLLGLTLLSEKAESLKAINKAIKDEIQSEQYKIEGVKRANDNVQKSIDGLVVKSQSWEVRKQKDIESLGVAMVELEQVDINQELVLHNQLTTWKDNQSKIDNLNKQHSTLKSALVQAEKNLNKYTRELEQLGNKSCPACQQELQDHKHEEMSSAAAGNLEDAYDYFQKISAQLKQITDEIAGIGELHNRPQTFYSTESEALSHKNNLDNLEKELTSKIQENNPYDEQIEDLKRSAIQELDWSTINQLTRSQDHHEFLLKLLTNKDSFIRKKIIDQNLNYLNKRLSYYINQLGLPHAVVFQNDLTVEITQFGQELDFHNLSRGEMNRLILSLSFAFRDVWESLYQTVNLLFIDELIDAGLDLAGVENTLTVLKKMSKERQKNIYLISHKEELIGKVNTVLRVVKSGGFTAYLNNDEEPNQYYHG
jgi:DNA repair exonuclease SbcCD ATPase subunit